VNDLDSKKRRTLRPQPFCIGVFAEGIGPSVWNVTADGTATEAGLGGSTGKAILAGRVMTIEWSHKNGWSGTYRWTMDAACKTGTGQLIFKSGGSGTRVSKVKHN